MAFLETTINLENSYVDKVAGLAPKLAKIYKFISMESNSDYSINGAQDPFLQVAILRLMKNIKKLTSSQ